ncbi:MAG: penicillin-binding protein activator LpoB [bacterium]|nr:penicillin-binding protein activator LpoB [bacterium]
MKNRRWLVLVNIFVLTIAILFIGCGGKKVTRIETSETRDLSGRWNDTDSRMVSEEVIKDALNHPWLQSFITKKGKNPTVIVGSIRNLSMEHIATGTFVKDIEKAFINSGRVTVVASALERGEIRDERREMKENADPETIKQMGKEFGADYMLTGEINAIEDREKKESVMYYQVDLTLTDIETNAKVWMGGTKIKKYIDRRTLKL